MNARRDRARENRATMPLSIPARHRRRVSSISEEMCEFPTCATLVIKLIAFRALIVRKTVIKFLDLAIDYTKVPLSSPSPRHRHLASSTHSVHVLPLLCRRFQVV